ncbi:MAG: hypothetical protein HY695_09340 [Deltaproteobacteria bacterium]|nr:hypothetical protein [Deltaproteobacteria bacterium]
MSGEPRSRSRFVPWPEEPVGALLAAVPSGWLGGEMVYVHGMGVEREARGEAAA